MSGSIYSIHVWLRRTSRAPWVHQQAFATGQAAAEWIAKEKARGRLRGETLSIVGDRNPNNDNRRK